MKSKLLCINKKNLNRFLSLLGILFACYLLSIFLCIQTSENAFLPLSETYGVMNALSDGVMMFLPVALAFAAATFLETNILISCLVSIALVYLCITDSAEKGVQLSLLHLPIIFANGAYTLGAIPILAIVYTQKKIEQYLSKIVPIAFKHFSQPFFTLLVLVPVVFLIIVPIGTILGNECLEIYNQLYKENLFLAAMLVGTCWQFLILFGMDWCFLPIFIANISTYGFDTLSPIVLCAAIGQAGASFGVYLQTKNENKKTLALIGSITSILGITDIAVYGTNLFRVKPFLIGCLTSGCFSGFFVTFSVRQFASGNPSIMTLPSYIGPHSNIFAAIIIYLLVFGISARLVTFLLVKEENRSKSFLALAN